MELQLLGPVEVRAAGRPLDAGGPRQRGVLAALAVDVGQPVMVDTAVDRAWGHEAPTRVRHALYVYVARLRKTISSAGAIDGIPAGVVRRSRGYVLEMDPECVDVHRFRRLVDLADDPRRPDTERVTLMRQSLDLWHGTPLASVPGQWAAAVREAWQQQRLNALVTWAQAELRLGNAGAVIGPLTEALSEHPFVEPLAAALMSALYASGRSADALDCYTRTRKRLVEQLGIDPGRELQQLHHAILRGDRDLVRGRWEIRRSDAGRGAPRPRPVRSRPQYPVPAHLPLDVPGFTGRAEELRRLHAIITAADERPRGVEIWIVSGTAGVGKTALAVHWAHHVSDRFPDGQLYVNLRGFDGTAPAMGPAQALRGFLDALGVPPQWIPSGLSAQIGLYRSLLTHRRVLVVLDNARDAEQVRPLLPGSAGPAVLVTSRNQLPGLVAAEGAHLLSLAPLSPAEARGVLARRLGPDRVMADPQAFEHIIAKCASLPLALAIVAARATANPTFPLSMLADELGDTRVSLDAFARGDLATDLRTTFSWSYNALRGDAARLFRLLAIHPCPDVATPAAARLAGVPLAEARRLLAELVRANLVAERAPGRFAFYGLLRAYATELCQALDTETERSAALRRWRDGWRNAVIWNETCIKRLRPEHAI